MKKIAIIFITFLKYYSTCSSLIRFFILYTSIALAMICFLNFDQAMGLIGLLKFFLPTLFVVPAIKTTLLNNEIEIAILKKFREYNYTNSRIIIFANILVTLFITLMISAPTFSYDYCMFLNYKFSYFELLFEFIKYSILLLFYIISAFMFHINNDFNNKYTISSVYGINIILFIMTVISFISEIYSRDYLLSKYFGGYFGTYVFIKLSLFGLQSDKIKHNNPIIDNNSVFGIPDDLSITIILALMSILMFSFTMLYCNVKFNKRYQEIALPKKD